MTRAAELLEVNNNYGDDWSLKSDYDLQRAYKSIMSWCQSKWAGPEATEERDKIIAELKKRGLIS